MPSLQLWLVCPLLGSMLGPRHDRCSTKIDFHDLKQIRLVFSQLGGSGVLVQPMTYIFDEEPVRWRQLLDMLGLKDAPAAA